MRHALQALGGGQYVGSGGSMRGDGVHDNILDVCLGCAAAGSGILLGIAMKKAFCAFLSSAISYQLKSISGVLRQATKAVKWLFSVVPDVREEIVWLLVISCGTQHLNNPAQQSEPKHPAMDWQASV
ncbi:hypothetical protein MASR1M59_19250 [Melaminivora sp.]